MCYTCHATGAVDAKKAPSTEALAQMLEPERSVRIYPEAYLELFTGPGYWDSRFPDWLIWATKLGQDPVTGHATFPVRTPQGYLAGVGRRLSDEAVAAAVAANEKAKEEGSKKTENPSRYRYPTRWSASRVLHDDRSPHGPALVLVEGAADAIALWEVGIPAAAVYGSGLHQAQVELVLRKKPKTIVLGMDNDEAGDRGARLSKRALAHTTCDIYRVLWPNKDPGDCTPKQRRAAVQAVLPTNYSEYWDEAAENLQSAYQKRDEE